MQLQNNSNLDTFILENLDFKKIKKVATINDGIIPVVIQDIKTLTVLTLGYINKQALLQSLKEKVVVLWSTSRNELWVKGKTSGNYLKLKDVLVNCEGNSLLFLVELTAGGACHTKTKAGEYRFSCYYRKIKT